MKEYLFNLFTEKAILEDCVAIILPFQLTLEHHFSKFCNFFPEPTLISQNHWAYIIDFNSSNGIGIMYYLGKYIDFDPRFKIGIGYWIGSKFFKQVCLSTKISSDIGVA